MHPANGGHTNGNTIPHTNGAPHTNGHTNGNVVAVITPTNNPVQTQTPNTNGKQM